MPKDNYSMSRRSGETDRKGQHGNKSVEERKATRPIPAPRASRRKEQKARLTTNSLASYGLLPLTEDNESGSPITKSQESPSLDGLGLQLPSSTQTPRRVSQSQSSLHQVLTPASSCTDFLIWSATDDVNSLGPSEQTETTLVGENSDSGQAATPESSDTPESVHWCPPLLSYSSPIISPVTLGADQFLSGVRASTTSDSEDSRLPGSPSPPHDSTRLQSITHSYLDIFFEWSVSDSPEDLPVSLFEYNGCQDLCQLLHSPSNRENRAPKCSQFGARLRQIQQNEIVFEEYDTIIQEADLVEYL